jgi:hypothetical protein
MKGYLCCLKLRRGDNSTYTFTKKGVVYLVSTTPPKRLIGFATIFLHAHLQVVYYKCVNIIYTTEAYICVMIAYYVRN